MNRVYAKTLLTIALVLGAVTAPANGSETWRRIDFDADLTSYLVEITHPPTPAPTARVRELNVPGRTSLSTGLRGYSMVERIFDCAAETQRLASVTVYRGLGHTGKSLAIPNAEIAVQPGSIDAVEMAFACHRTVPAMSEVSADYMSVADAVEHAFGDAIKLPRELSNKTLRGLGPMGAPPANGLPGLTIQPTP